MGILKKLFGQKEGTDLTQGVETPEREAVKPEVKSEEESVEKTEASVEKAEEKVKQPLDMKKVMAGAQAEPMIQCFDAYGRPIRVSRAQWLTNVLPGVLKAHWNNANALYADLLQAVQNGASEELREAASHLKEIDAIPERSHIMYAIVAMKCKAYEDAKATLNEFIESHGKTGAILTNLAKAYYEAGEKEKAEEILLESLELEPNQMGGIAWYAALYNQREGREGKLRALEQVAAFPNSWAAKLYIAREYLEDKDLDRAKALYLEVLETSPDNNEAMMNISGDLGQKGYVKEIVELIQPRYVFEKHDFRVGLNLLQAYLQTENLEAGEPLLSKLLRLERVDLKDRLLRMADSFEQIRAKNYVPVKPEDVKIEMVAFTQPIWYYGLNAPTWLEPKIERNKKVAILPYSAISKIEKQAGTREREDELGRLSRSIPLYLEEVLTFTTNYKPEVILPIAKDLGPTITSKPYTPESLLEMAERLDVDYVIAGMISQDGNDYAVTNMIYETESETVTTVDQSLTEKAFGPSFVNMITEIQELLGNTCTETVPHYTAPIKPEEVKIYLASLSQALMQTIVMNSHIKKEALWGERNIINWYVNMCLGYPKSELPKFMLVASLVRSRAYGSGVYLEFRRQTLQLVSQSKLAHKLLPLVYKLYGMEQAFEESKAKLTEANQEDQTYVDWLNRI